MAIWKWICGAMGWAAGGTLGGILGFCIGKLMDDAFSGSSSSSQAAGSSSQGGMGGSGYGTQGERNSFLFSLLVLSSYIIRADGKVMHSEMEVAREFLRQNFGEQGVAEGERILLRLFELQKQRGMTEFKETIRRSCIEIRMHTGEGERLQLLYYLVLIAKADGQVPAEELRALQEVAYYLGLDPSEVVSMLNLNSGDSGQRYEENDADKLAEAYKVLGVASSATDSEVKAAFRKMALKHHPDRVAALGEDVRKAAERKFQEINDAKERIYKSRGMS